MLASASWISIQQRGFSVRTDTAGQRESDAPHVVTPLGVFGVIASQPDFERVRGELLALAGAIPEGERESIAMYLRAGTIVFALMEHTRDVVDSAFQVAGGSAVLTDGAYYWRLDAADYVEHYGTGLPDAFLRHGRSLGWLARPMAQEDIIG